MIAQFPLPYPPSVNRYWRNVHGRTLISAEGRRYRTAALAAVQQALCDGLLPKGMQLHQELKVSIDATMPDRRKRDLDNLFKAALDGLTAAGVWQDDSQIVDLHIRKVGVAKGGGLMVSIDLANQLSE